MSTTTTLDLAGIEVSDPDDLVLGSDGHEDGAALLVDDQNAKWIACKAQLWVSILTIFGALMYTIYAYGMMTERMRVKAGYEVIAGVAALVWLSPIIGTVQTVITAIKATQRSRDDNISLGVAFKVIVVLEQILFVGSVIGIVWVLSLPKIPRDPGSRVLQYVFLPCPYILAFNSLFHCDPSRLLDFCSCSCCFNRGQIQQPSSSPKTRAETSPPISSTCSCDDTPGYDMLDDSVTSSSHHQHHHQHHDLIPPPLPELQIEHVQLDLQE